MKLSITQPFRPVLPQRTPPANPQDVFDDTPSPWKARWLDVRALGKVAVHAMLGVQHSALEKLTPGRHPALSDESPVALTRPLVLVPGWSTDPARFASLTEKLLQSGKNGRQAYFVKEGRFFQDRACQQEIEGQQLDPKAKVFVLQFESSRQSPDESAAQMNLCMEAIKRRTTGVKLDMVGYSMGGLEARKYLDGGGQGVGKLMLLATPNHGSAIIAASSWLVRRDIRWALAIAGMHESDLGALRWMTPGSVPLTRLNDHLDRQKGAVEAIETVGCNDLPTVHSGFFPGRDGDGLVEQQSLQLPGVESRILRGEARLQHGEVLGSSKAFAEMRSFFGWTTMPKVSS